ncbi:MAG: hypothetical protein RJQ07_00055 [Pseudomonadales bacterium]
MANRATDRRQWMTIHSGRLVLAIVAANILLAVMVLSSNPRPVPRAIEPLALLGEQPLHLLSEVASEPVAPQPAAQPPAAALECRVWGPTADAAELEIVHTALSAQGYAVDQTATEEQIGTTFLVFIPSTQTATTNQVAQSLTAAGIENYVMGGNAGARVSIGLFSSQQGAFARQQAASKLGLSAEIEILPRYRKMYRLSAWVTPDSSEFLSSNSPCAAFAHSA